MRRAEGRLYPVPLARWGPGAAGPPQVSRRVSSLAASAAARFAAPGGRRDALAALGAGQRPPQAPRAEALPPEARPAGQLRERPAAGRRERAAPPAVAMAARVAEAGRLGSSPSGWAGLAVRERPRLEPGGLPDWAVFRPQRPAAGRPWAARRMAGQISPGCLVRPAVRASGSVGRAPRLAERRRARSPALWHLAAPTRRDLQAGCPSPREKRSANPVVRQAACRPALFRAARHSAGPTRSDPLGQSSFLDATRSAGLARQPAVRCPAPYRAARRLPGPARLGARLGPSERLRSPEEPRSAPARRRPVPRFGAGVGRGPRCWKWRRRVRPVLAVWRCLGRCEFRSGWERCLDQGQDCQCCSAAARM